MTCRTMAVGQNVIFTNFIENSYSGKYRTNLHYIGEIAFAHVFKQGIYGHLQTHASMAIDRTYKLKHTW